MTVSTTRSLINSLATRWLSHYPLEEWGDKKIMSRNETFGEVYFNLLNTDLTKLNKSQATRLVGLSSWVDLRCDECNRSVNWIITVGAEPDYESNTASLCKDCLSLAYSKI